MPVLENYAAFDGYYWQTGTIRNVLDFQGVKAPHTGKPYSEALLYGVSGGAAFGYFYFHYEGYDPQINILTRNTFNLFEPILERLGIPYEVIHSSSAEKGRQNLIDALERGEAPIVQADMFHLPYNRMDLDDANWAVMPIVVYGYEDGTAYIADRARVGLTAPAKALDAARARVKKDKHRIIILGAPDEGKLQSAVSLGLWDCVKLFTESPPKGSRNNFGLTGYQHWIEMLTKPGKKNSWTKILPEGELLYAGLKSAFSFSQLFGKDASRTAERDLFAAFLQEAAVILDKPDLAQVADQFRAAGQAWRALGDALLPDDVPLLKQTREALVQQHEAFLFTGEMTQVETLKALRAQAGELGALENVKTRIAEQVRVLHDLERDAIASLQGII